MRSAFATLAVAGLAAANPMPQAVTSAIAPAGSPPPGCYPNYDGTFLIAPVNVSSSSKRGIEEVGFEIVETRNTKLGISLQGGILTDPQGRTGYIAANQQFQFDGPPQAGAIWTAGFSVCNNKRLALGSDDTWYKCLSGGFFNLYFHSIGGQCIESYLLTRVDTGTGELSGGPPASGVVTSTANSASAGASGSATGSSGSSSPTAGGTNGTATASGSMSGSANTTATASASSSGMTGTGGGQTTGTMTTGGGGQMTGTTGTGGGSPTAGGAAQSSSSQQAAPLATLRSEMLGLAAGVLALAAL